jgi:hypothetical protein
LFSKDSIRGFFCSYSFSLSISSKFRIIGSFSISSKGGIVLLLCNSGVSGCLSYTGGGGV